MLKGVRISRGVALGRLYLYAPFVPQVEQGPCMPGGEEAQRQAYRRAKEASAKELRGLAEALQARGSAQSGIFQAHLEILDDVVMEEEILDAITQERATAGEAVDRVYRAYAKAVARAREPVIRERARDLDDVRGRILRNHMPGCHCSPKPGPARGVRYRRADGTGAGRRAGRAGR